MAPDSPAFGRHFIVELCACSADAIADAEVVERALVLAAERAGATILDRHFHRFEPHGVSGLVIIAESHLSIHTWPEHRYAAVDIFTCGEHMAPERGIELLIAQLGAGSCHVTELTRGAHALIARPLDVREIRRP